MHPGSVLIGAVCLALALFGNARVVRGKGYEKWLYDGLTFPVPVALVAVFFIEWFTHTVWAGLPFMALAVATFWVFVRKCPQRSRS